jgi:corrinoid protein of di/trimethylamine methyltransferase
VGEDLLLAMAESVIEGDKEAASRLAQQAIAEKMSALTVITQGFVKGIQEVGERFAAGDCYLPELVMAAEALKRALAILEPELEARGQELPSFGKAIAGTVQGDMHDIGKSIVCTMFVAHGFEVVDLGVDVSPERFVEAVRQHQPDLVLLSALLTTTMPIQGETIEALVEADLRDQVKVMVGGAPTTPEWSDRIHADGHGADAIAAVALAKLLLDAPA